ncbi:MAG: amylo-alpha-1,6-glucosidase [Minisyncoccia bacterium]
MDIVREAQDLLRKNRRVTDGHQYTVPSPEKYPYQWLWDSCFHAIVLASFEPDAGKAELRALLSKQLPDGMVPHIIYWEPSELIKYDWGLPGTSTLTQPPMLAYAAWELYRRTNDAPFLEELYPGLMRFYQFLINKRDPHDHHLVGIINPDESGEDNSPRFDAMLHVSGDISQEDHLKRRLELIDANRACHFDAELCMSRHFWVKDVPFNAIFVKNLEALGHIASLLGRESDEHFCSLHAGLIKDAMRERLFADGIYRSTMGLDYEPISTKTWAMFAPLFADLYSHEEAESLVSTQLADPETFAAPWGLRTVSKTEETYRPDGFWRGPVWLAPHWFVYQGLKAYGFEKQAAALRDKSIALIERSGFREYFDPETGEGYGARDFTWGALVLDMMQA